MLKLSVSSMDTYKSCAKKYHYRYVEKVEVAREKWIFTEFGSCAHLMLELFHNKVTFDTDPNDYAKIMKGCFKEAIKEFSFVLLNQKVWSPNGDINGLRYLKEIMQTYLDGLKKDGLPNVVGTEIAYQFNIREDVCVRGYIDRIDKVADGEYRVIDYKTSKNPKYLKKFQLLVYANAIKLMYPDAEKISGSFILLKHNFRSVDYKFTELDLDDSYNQILNNLDLIENETKWVKNPTMLCNWCDYKKICQDSWSE